ncbi:hypothetical protein TNCV_556881 [Trichonephila clavipes]|uniref:Uncharacterized protein n=1 Tax=Trichonephila clavipes TaxID=2585209 RepID=A0A8X6V2V1_TRICX|nr:hypothetical protein TNCV_556881 [Trichonephila clavipes]
MPSCWHGAVVQKGMTIVVTNPPSGQTKSTGPVYQYLRKRIGWHSCKGGTRPSCPFNYRTHIFRTILKAKGP